MPTLTLTPDGFTVDGNAISLPMSTAEALRLFGKVGRKKKLAHGTSWPFPALSLIAHETTTAPNDPARPIVQLAFEPRMFKGAFTIDGVPWNEVVFPQTDYGLELQLGCWVVSPGDDEWSLSVSEKKVRTKMPAQRKHAELKPEFLPMKATRRAGKGLAGIEAAFGVTLPSLLGRLWSERAFDDTKRSKASVLHADLDFVPIRPNDIAAAADELRAVFGVAVDEHQLVPFGRSEQGDHYCLHFGGKRGATAPVVYLANDDDDAVFVARSLEDFLFRRTLEAIAVAGAGEDRREDNRRMAAAVKPYLAAGHARALGELAEHGKLPVPAREVKRLLTAHVAFPKLGKRFSARSE